MSIVRHLKFGPADHERPLTRNEFAAAAFEPGYRYEIIGGRLAVAPVPNPKENILEEWIGYYLRTYARANPDVVNYVSSKARVFVHARPEDTVPEPDLAAYAGFPLDQDSDEIRWEEQTPILVVEVMTGDDQKDLGRNVQLYLEVPSIQEYWVVDGRLSANEPALIQHRRHGKRWVVQTYAYEAVLTTDLLPKFELVIDPRK